jgi:hypothetical protein
MKFRDAYWVSPEGARKPRGFRLRGIHAFREPGPGASVRDSAAGLLVSAAAGTETLRISL